MSNFTPKGRKSLPIELLKFGRHLVYTEGTRTEPYYIDDIKENIAKKYNCEPNEIELIKASSLSKSLHTVDLVTFAINDVNARLNKNEHIDHVWIFFDKDDFKDFDKADTLIRNKNTEGYKNFENISANKDTEIAWHSCWSNECFELWLWLYFDYCETPISREEYKDKLNNQKSLKKIKFKYEKNLKNIHTILQKNGGNIKNAIANAKKLNNLNERRCPSTGVCDFAEYFLQYLADK